MRRLPNIWKCFRKKHRPSTKVSFQKSMITSAFFKDAADRRFVLNAAQPFGSA